MASRHSAARPKHGGDVYARTHHNKEGADSKKVVFDVRDPSKLAPDAREDDDILDHDVIGGKSSTKRGAVNIDGYDSDSDNDTFNAQAQTRKRGKVDILDQLDNYDARRADTEESSAPGKKQGPTDDDDDDDDDMFAADPEENEEKKDQEQDDDDDDDDDFKFTGHKKDGGEFLDTEKIAGQESKSRSGGHVRLDDTENQSSDDEEDADLAMQEEGLDEEVGAGGLKKNAPKLEAFNLREEMEEGQFDQSGNYIRRAGDPDAEHDNWLQGLGKKDMKKAAEAHMKREQQAREQRLAADNVLVSDLLKSLIVHLEKTETPLEALARLGKRQTKPKKIPQWKLKKLRKDGEGMEVDQSGAEDPEQVRIREAITTITDAADKLLNRDYEEVYDQERELLVREYRRETGEDWVEPRPEEARGHENATSNPSRQWEFRWLDGRDGGALQGPFDGPTMKAWQDAGYFTEGVEFRPVGEGAEWSKVATFS
ncbi:hypothetical protein V2G26_016162 [Clonostachys chloroleuca]